MHPYPGNALSRAFRPASKPTSAHRGPSLIIAVLVLLFFCVSSLGAEEIWYRIQLSAWKELSSATNHFNALKATLAKEECQSLRLEKVNRDNSPYRYGVYVGMFREKSEALRSLQKYRTLAPKAFVFGSSRKPEELVLACSGDGGTGFSPTGGGSEESFPAGSENPNLALLRGKVIESTSVEPGLLGLDADKALYRVVVFVDAIEGVPGHPNYLIGKNQQYVTFFTENPLPADLSGKKIAARAQYRGNRYGMHFWIEAVREDRR
ncbi:MAG: hypothetical protein M0009_00800 [Deltaproteobacteria bacterium]|nr:hypothetical protein [Deltaproteobacteria bacterium]